MQVHRQVRAVIEAPPIPARQRTVPREVQQLRPSERRNLYTPNNHNLAPARFELSAQLPVRYVVEECLGVLEPSSEALVRDVDTSAFPPMLGNTCSGGRRLLAVDHNIAKLHEHKIRKYFQEHDVPIHFHAIQADEQNKDFDQVFSLAAAMHEFSINRRNEPVIAIGGGVTLDTAGLACNLYRRNTPVIKVPTTLMGMVDAAIGIKTAVNFDQHKNRLGTYCAPMAVFLDPTFLSSLHPRHVANGAAEIIKMACMRDGDLFEALESYAQTDGYDFQGDLPRMIINRSVELMLQELEPNFWEAELYRLVDFGHSFSPHLEMEALASDFPLLHGEAVAIDMALSTCIARMRGLISQRDHDRTLQLLIAYRLPIWHEKMTAEHMIYALESTTRGRDGLQRLPVATGELGGATFINDLTNEEVSQALNNLRTYAQKHTSLQLC
ncbi:hypothetical protein WJX74_003386 [Apatococcus lobatus]|uniref:2-epi-5-epi-valiolone synthase n=2 Tax=Apatococcus TaxID=904362 RepID=A0AAW1T0X5_9CHLO